MAIHVDLHPKNLENLKNDARGRGMTTRDLASQTIGEIFSGDRSVFIFTPAMPPEMLPRVQIVMDTAMRNVSLFEQFEKMATEQIEKEKEEKENARIKELKTEDASV